MLPKISFIIPLYNEEETFRELTSRLSILMDSLDFECEVVLIDDGSKDQTSILMNQIGLQDERFHCIFLSRNFGHQTALTAGLKYARGTEAVMVLDGDLQDPPELITEFLKKHEEGYDVVYGIRKKRKENFLKKLCYSTFYRLQKKLVNIDIPIDTGDFSLVSRKVIDVLNKMPEESRYIRGMRAWIGFKQTGVEYERSGRFAGKTKYSITKLFNLAFNGIFNFSEFPIKLITRLGIFTFLIALGYLVYTLVKKYLMETDIPEGFTGLIILITMLSGVQLISLGLIGEYVVRIFFQSKQRPPFVIKGRIVQKERADE